MPCDTFVVLPSVSKAKRVIFGKNSDRPGTEVQEVIYHNRRILDSNTIQNVSFKIVVFILTLGLNTAMSLYNDVMCYNCVSKKSLFVISSPQNV